MSKRHVKKDGAEEKIAQPLHLVQGKQKWLRYAEALPKNIRGWGHPARRGVYFKSASESPAIFKR
jgi:hypothetical protein